MSTTQPRKQRRLLYQAPLHIRHKKLSAPLSQSLKTSHKANSIPVRKGDTVRVTRGDRKGTEGKVTRVNQKSYRLFIEGITREKVDGTTTLIPIHPSKVIITSLDLDDKWRRASLKAEPIAKKLEESKEKHEEKKPRTPKKRRRKKKLRISATKKMKEVKTKKNEGLESG